MVIDWHLLASRTVAFGTQNCYAETRIDFEEQNPATHNRDAGAVATSSVASYADPPRSL